MKEIQGSGGGGGGGDAPPPPIIENDTLASRQKVKLLLAISEGEIEGIDEVLLNDIDISNYDASWDWRPGTATQTVIPGFIDTEEPVASFAPANLTYNTPLTTIVPYNAGSCRITLALTRLQLITSNNDTVGYSVTIEVSTRPNSSAIWSFLKNVRKTGKASSPYNWDSSIPRPAGTDINDSWEIRLTRLTADDTPANKASSETSWAAATAIYESELTYPNTALLAITLFDAEQFGSNIPSITVKPKGIKVRIPTNYNPVTHLYDEGTPWDGSLTEGLFHYVRVPAWHIYDVLRRTKAQGGFGIDATDIDVVSLYNLSKYSDELVDDGKGGTERRYQLDNQFSVREHPQVFLMFLLNICNANITSNEFGQISVMYDRPNQAVTKHSSNSNVIDGEFSYSSSELESRYNLVNVTYNREEFKGKTDTASWTEDSLVARYGLQNSDMVLPGCTSEAMALRKARWAVYTNSFLPNAISYKKLFAGLSYQVGELDRIFDNDNQGTVQSGVIKSFSNAGGTGTLQLDRFIDLSADPYTVTFMNVDGVTEESYAIFETDQTTDAISFIGTANPAVNGIFLLAGPIISKVYKIVKVTKEEDVYSILAIEHDEAKYSYIDQGVILSAPSGDFVDASVFLVPPVTNVTIVENFSSNGITQKSSLDVSWDWDLASSSYAALFKLTWKRDDQDSHYEKNLTGLSFDILDPVPGLYEVTVWAVSPFSGIASTPVTQTYNFRTTAAESSLQPPIDIFVAGTGGLEFSSQDLHLTFAYDPANTNVSDTLLDYTIEVWNSTTTTLYGEYVVKPNAQLGGSFTFPFSENVDRFGTATRTFNLKLRSRDVMGDVSAAAQVQVTNPAPGLVSFTLSSGTEATYVNIIASTERDIAGYIIYRDDTDINFTPTPAHVVYDGTSTSAPIAGASGTTYYFKVAVYDTFSKLDVTATSGQSTSLQSASVDTWIFEGLIFKPNDPGTNQISWTAGSASKNGAAPIAIAAGNTTWTTGILFIYYDGSSSTLSASTDLTIVNSGVMPLANYRGGVDLITGNGDAYVDGGLILANTVGANQLVADSAIITNNLQLGSLVVDTANIANAAIENAKIANIIESPDYNESLFDGWRIDKAGNITSFGTLELKDGLGNTIISTGDNAQVEWGKVDGINVPEDNATVGASFGELGPAEQSSTLTLNGTNLISRSISKIGGVEDAWDASAYSVENYTGACIVSFKTSDAVARSMVGLSTNPSAGVSYTTIDFALYVRFGTDVVIYESGQSKITVGSYTTTDVFQVHYNGVDVFYKKNGVTFYTSLSSSPGLTLYLDSSMATLTSAVNTVTFNSIISGVEQNNTLTLVNHANTAIAGTQVTTVTTTSQTAEKTAGLTEWFGHAVSEESYDRCVVRGTIGQLNVGMMLGLNDQQFTKGYIPLQYALYINSINEAYIYESGSQISSLGPAALNDEFEIKYDFGNIEYRLNGSLVRTISIGTGRTFYLDAVLREVGAKFENLEFNEIIDVVLEEPSISGQITPSNVVTFIANLAVQEAQIAALAVTEAKIADLAVTTAKIQDLAVDTLQIQNEAVTIQSGASGGSSASVFVTLPIGTPVIIIGLQHITIQNQIITIRLYVDNVIKRSETYEAGSFTWIKMGFVIQLKFVTTAPSHTYRVQATVGAATSYITVDGAKK